MISMRAVSYTHLVVDYFGEDRVCAGVYDGDTPASERSRIRKNANLILTNPEMLNRCV